MPGRVKFMGMLMWTRKSSLGRYRVVLSSSGGRYLLYIAACEVCQGENNNISVYWRRSVLIGGSED